MVEALCHESFYVTGTWMDESQGVYVGWALRKDSFSDGMPIRNEREEVSLVFSGEEFPEPGTTLRLKELGHAVEKNGPSYLVHLYEEDTSFPAGLNGRFHGLLTDRTLQDDSQFQIDCRPNLPLFRQWLFSLATVMIKLCFGGIRGFSVEAVV